MSKKTDFLDLLGVIAFDGVTRNGLWLHPDGEHLLYPMGCKVIVRNLKSDEQSFLTGHRNIISALCVSSCGKSIATGDTNRPGFKATVAIWNYEERKMRVISDAHDVRVEDVRFNCDGNYLVSLGGREDGNIVVWDVREGIFVAREAVGKANVASWLNACAQMFVTVGDGTFKLWRVDSEKRKICGIDVKFGKIKRTINCVAIDEKDEKVYCGTSSGDIVEARLNLKNNAEYSSLKVPIMIGCYSKIGNSKRRTVNAGEGDLYAGGVTNLLLLREEKMLVGTGDGTIELIHIPPSDLTPPTVKTSKSLVTPRIITLRAGKVCSSVTSIASMDDQKYVLVGTVLCEIYKIDFLNFHTQLLITCHAGPIHDLAFPRDSSEIFATASKNDIRVWNAKTLTELLRITVTNFVCSSLCFDRNGCTIISAWNDGAIRGFSSNDGELAFVIDNAHAKVVSTIAITNDNCKLVSGGCDGQVRVWDAKSKLRRLLKVFKEHRAPVTSLRITLDDKYLISTSTDGTCLIWDAKTFKRRCALMGWTMYMAACFVPSGVQVLTCGTDRKVAYWETVDGSLVREIEGSTSGTLNTIDVSPDGRYFITGSDDLTVRLWDYRLGRITRLGLAHAAPITVCAFTSDGKSILTGSADGALMLWKNPFDV